MLFLEHDVDRPSGNRIGRWWAARGSTTGTVYLPLVMADSGHLWSNGPTDYVASYRSMVNAALGREPDVSIQAWAQRVGEALRIWATVNNLGATPLSPANDATVNALVWEEAHIGATNRYVRAAPAVAIASALAPGDTASFVLDATLPGNVQWDAVHTAVAVDFRPAGRSGPYDMLQAAAAAPPAITAIPAQVGLQAMVGSADMPRAAVRLEGPHVVSWTATTPATWLRATPTTGSLPAEVELSVASDGLTPGLHTGELVIAGTSADGLALSCRLAVTVEILPRRHPVRLKIPASGGS